MLSPVYGSLSNLFLLFTSDSLCWVDLFWLLLVKLLLVIGSCTVRDFFFCVRVLPQSNADSHIWVPQAPLPDPTTAKVPSLSVNIEFVSYDINLSSSLFLGVLIGISSTGHPTPAAVAGGPWKLWVRAGPFTQASPGDPPKILCEVCAIASRGNFSSLAGNYLAPKFRVYLLFHHIRTSGVPVVTYLDPASFSHGSSNFGVRAHL